MSRPYAGTGLSAAGSAIAFWATDLYASNLASLPGEAVSNLGTALSTLPAYVATHGPLPTTAPLAVATGLAAACGVWVAWANAVARRGNYRAGEEHGSARWATPKELRRLSDPRDPDDNIILTRDVRLAMSRDDHDPRWERNRNVVVIGGSGSGKTRTYVEPNLMQMNASYLVTDPKGTTVGGSAPCLWPTATTCARSTPSTSRSPCATTRSPTSARSRTCSSSSSASS